MADHKHIIYQLFPRLFGNTQTLNRHYGSIGENGCGKFNDITEKALQEINSLGCTHVWYTGVIEHATMTDYSSFGIKPDDPDVVKGRAGSPYAIKDYYDVDPDLAVDVNQRMAEFEALVGRTHAAGMEVIIDFVPNHVARTYASDKKPDGVRDIGADDDGTRAFSAQNDFYYLPGQPFKVPGGYNPGGDAFSSPLKDGRFDENPAKATGNDVFSASPGINDWFETIKLNYGVDYLSGRTNHFDPVPPLWQKLNDILHFWAAKGIDGFRCDMVEMVPFEFWGWIIGRLKADFPGLIFIGEAYNAGLYRRYLNEGKFDYLYDKVGLYEAIRRLTCGSWGANTWEINAVWNNDTKDIDERMLRFMENHDEQRIASRYFAGSSRAAIPGMIVTATLATGPVMIYAGQEVGEPAEGSAGFSGDDGRTTIFDYWSAPELRKWVNNGRFDGGGLSDEQRQLRAFYSKLLNAVRDNEALREGKFWELMLANERQPGFDTRIYIYLRYTGKQRILVVANFNAENRDIRIVFPDDLCNLLNSSGEITFADLLSGRCWSGSMNGGVQIQLGAMDGLLLSF